VINLNELPQITSDFLDENEKLCQSMPKSHKPGPYTKFEKETRRDEVYRLHFDYGYSARKISKLMKIPRSTVNSDINFWYSKITNSRSFIDPENTIITNLARMEQQRIRIREYLDNYKSLHDKLAIERMLNDVDFRINNTYLKLSDSNQRNYDYIVDEVNKLAKKNQIKSEFLTLFDILHVSSKTHKKIDQLIIEDRNRKRPR